MCDKISGKRIPRVNRTVVKKYLKRERGKELPANADFWDFDCRYGVDQASSEVINVSAINKAFPGQNQNNSNLFI